MPTLAEFTLTLFLRRDEGNGRTWTVFRFSTERQFRSFQYEIKVEATFDKESRAINFRMLGVGTSPALMPAAGSAVREYAYEGLSGSYDVSISGAKQSGKFTMTIGQDHIAVTDAELSGVRIEIEKGVVATER